MPTKKYKLSSASASGKAICAFFNTAGGCKSGERCKFLHTKETTLESVCTPASTKKNIVNDTSSSSVVSSESSDNESIPTKAVTPTTSKPLENPADKKQKKKKSKQENNQKENEQKTIIKTPTKTCSYFNTEKGCKNGENCTFLHEMNETPQKLSTSAKKTKKKNTEKKTLSQEEQFQHGLLLLQQQQKQIAELKEKLLNQQASDKKQKKTKKRKKQDSSSKSIFAIKPNDTSSVSAKKLKAKPVEESPFLIRTPPVQNKIKTSEISKVGSYAALAKSHASVSSESENLSNESESEDEEDEGLNYLKELKSSLANQSPQNISNSSPMNSNGKESFRSLELPIAPFTGKGRSNTVPSNTPSISKKKSSSVEDEEPTISIPCPLPRRKSEGYKYIPAINATRDHPRFSKSYNILRFRETNGLSGDSKDWVKTAKCNDPKKININPQVIAIDCEMVETTDPVTGTINGKDLCRLSVVNALNTSDVLIDTLVKPSWPVTNYRTFVNGIKKEDLENVQFTLRHAQAFMLELCNEETVIIGHAVYNDLHALKMEHYCNVDTSFIFQVKDDNSEDGDSTPSLKDCASTLLRKEMPNIHDSVNDAITSLECCNHYLEQNGNVEKVTRSRKRSEKLYALLVHRIPRQGCTKNDLAMLFVLKCNIKPESVDEIEFGPKTGKSFVRFSTAEHAKLAFDLLDGAAKVDKSGRNQKRVYLRNGKDHIHIRSMERASV